MAARAGSEPGAYRFGGPARRSRQHAPVIINTRLAYLVEAPLSRRQSAGTAPALPRARGRGRFLPTGRPLSMMNNATAPSPR
jgi:hypothetical protein